ncbi:MAG TPA: PF20097 family protein [Pyrinomonadaceae bacterium]|nr:PF20097 family protein [Pyrinomonadaceae bacterium]
MADCPKCGTEMAQGFILDRSHYDSKSQQVWVAGSVEQSFWSGIRTSDRDAFNVEAFRCAAFGRLDLYTTDQVDLGGVFS